MLLIEILDGLIFFKYKILKYLIVTKAFFSYAKFGTS